MKKIYATVMLLLCSAWPAPASTTVNITGTVTKTGAGPLKGVTVTLANIPGPTAITDSTGKFTLTSVRALQMNSPQASPLEFTLKGKTLTFSPGSAPVSGSVEVFSGSGRRTASLAFTDLRPGKQSLSLPAFGPGLNIVRIVIDNVTYTCPVVRLGNELYVKNDFSGAAPGREAMLAKRSAGPVNDTLIAKKQGFTDKKTPVASYTLTGLAVSMDSAGGGTDCVVPAMPAFSAMPKINELPDPFTMMDGTRMTKKSQWTCRREEIKALAQKCIYGWKPGKPDKIVPSYSGGTLTIKCTVGGKTDSFSVKISGNSGAGPYPAIIAVAGFATYTTPTGVAGITFSEQQVAKSDVNGRDPPAGMFYNLYPAYKSTGSAMAWAWGVSRVIDALETPEMKTATKIDPHKLGVTGCSYAGKAAFAIGVWDQRIALTLPVESGAGGIAAWRIAEEHAPPGKKSMDQNGCQYLFETWDESTWMGDSLNQFRGKEYTLPLDMHEVAALIAPRGFLGLGYSTPWICAEGEWGTGLGARLVYEALGYPDNIGMLIGKASSHCSKASGLKEQEIYNAFVKKFLQGDATVGTAAATAFRNDAGYPMTDAKYIPWTKPALEGDYPAATLEKE